MSGSVLVTGASGQVGLAVLRLLKREMSGVEVIAPVRAELDLSNVGSVRSYVAKTKPRWIVSCGAYTAVDLAETHAELAQAVNASAPGVLAEEAAKAGAGLIHFSTDYVFNGSGERPWLETDATGPINVYGASKLAGEQAIMTAAATSPLAWVVLRTSWVYSGGGKNFARTMLRLLSTRMEPLRIVADQHGAPTSAADLAAAVLAILRASEDKPVKMQSGVYHCAGSGETTWAGFAGAVRDYLCSTHGLDVSAIVPVATSEYPTPAARPLNSRLNCDRLRAVFGVQMPPWQNSLTEALRELASTDLPGR